MIFCALSNHTTKVQQAQAAIIRFSTIPYVYHTIPYVTIRYCTISHVTIRYCTFPYDFTCYHTFPYDSVWFHTLFSSLGFLTVHSGDSRWALPRVRGAAWRSFGSRCTCGRPSPPWACWGVRAPTFVRSSSSSSCCRKSRQRVPTRLDSLPFPASPICRKIAHHAAYFLPFLVGTHEFGFTCVRFQEREKYWNDGQVHVFCRFREKKRQFFRASALFGHAWWGDFADDLSWFCILSYSRVCCKLLVISTWEGGEDRKAFQFQLFQLNFKGWRFCLLLYISI